MRVTGTRMLCSASSTHACECVAYCSVEKGSEGFGEFGVDEGVGSFGVVEGFGADEGFGLFGADEGLGLFVVDEDSEATSAGVSAVELEAEWAGVSTVASEAEWAGPSEVVWAGVSGVNAVICSPHFLR